MKTLYFTQSDIRKVLDTVRLERPNRVVILGFMEWQIPEIDKQFVDTLKELNVELTIIHGCFRSQYHDEYYNSIDYPVENVIFWGTHFFNHMLMHMKHTEDNNPYTYNPGPFKHKFISLNNRSHIHRCAFIEEMSKQNLLDKGIVTWIAHLNENSDYPYQYFDGNKRLLNDDFINHLDSYQLPIEYHESLFEIVTESTPHVRFLTEKTVRNLLLKKPFVILGSRYIHHSLMDLGFKLYDEVIDYSFEHEEDLLKRTEMVVNNIHNILKYDPIELYEILKPKLEYNYNRAMTIVTDKELIPVEFKQSTVETALLNAYLNADFKKAKYLNIWEAMTDSTYIEHIGNLTQYSMLVIDQMVEYQYNQMLGINGAVDNIIQHAKEYDLPIKLLTSVRAYDNIERLNNDSLAYDKLEILDSPGYWLALCFNHNMYYDHARVNKQNQLDVLDNDVNLNTTITDLYISMNHLAHPHRCMMMDILAKHNMIAHGKIAWRDIIRYFDNDRTDVPDSIRLGFYKYQYWTPERMYLDQEEVKSNINQEILPTQYKNSFMQLVCESTTDLFFLTEKTATALLYNKIFLTVGSKDFHKNLVDMGFKLYDNLFDYSFDSLDNEWDRIEGVVENIKRYKDMPMTDLEQLRRDNEHIIRHNRTVALDYVFNRIPKQFELIEAILSGQGVPNKLRTLYLNLGLKNEL